MKKNEAPVTAKPVKTILRKAKNENKDNGLKPTLVIFDEASAIPNHVYNMCEVGRYAKIK